MNKNTMTNDYYLRFIFKNNQEVDYKSGNILNFSKPDAFMPRIRKGEKAISVTKVDPFNDRNRNIELFKAAKLLCKPLIINSVNANKGNPSVTKNSLIACFRFSDFLNFCNNHNIVAIVSPKPSEFNNSHCAIELTKNRINVVKLFNDSSILEFYRKLPQNNIITYLNLSQIDNNFNWSDLSYY